MEDIKAILHYTQDYTEFKIQDVVYLKTDPEQLERIVYSITIYPSHVIYSLVQGNNTSGHFPSASQHRSRSRNQREMMWYRYCCKRQESGN